MSEDKISFSEIPQTVKKTVIDFLIDVTSSIQLTSIEKTMMEFLINYVSISHPETIIKNFCKNIDLLSAGPEQLLLFVVRQNTLPLKIDTLTDVYTKTTEEQKKIFAEYIKVLDRLCHKWIKNE